MMDANNQLNHDPPNNWTCYSRTGTTRRNSNISSTPGVLGVDLYMVDYGNETTMGHRRWILSNTLGPVGIGSTSEMSCLLVIGGQRERRRAVAGLAAARAGPVRGDARADDRLVETSTRPGGRSRATAST
jgi:hypothetical protein